MNINALQRAGARAVLHAWIARMLFNSAAFIFGFLPIVLLGFLVLAGTGRRHLAGLWLTAASLLFYGYWDPRAVPLLIASMAFNFWLGKRLSHAPSKLLLTLGITANLALLGYYKYTGFFVTTLSDLFELGWTSPHIVLPLAISFFTFQQIAYLCDACDGLAEEHDFASYCLFITFFPHLIAGPITHHREMLPQFRDAENFRPRWDMLSVGLTLFVIGLFKKVVVADPFSVVVKGVFDAAASGQPISVLDGWGGALGYAVQLYFDFSGYTDMAVGLGMMFCIRLPQNFNSPYKATNIIDFWSRWHMTLTRFLTSYVYNPLVLGLTRARARRGLPPMRAGRIAPRTWLAMVAFPTLLTMFVSGLWHGAGWSFVVWGLIHGVYLCVAHAWRALKRSRGWRADAGPLWRGGSVLLTFGSVVVALVFFRANSLPAALRFVGGMFGLDGLIISPAFLKLPGLSQLARTLDITIAPLHYVTTPNLVWIGVALTAIWCLPNAQQLLRLHPTALQIEPTPSWLQRRWPSLLWRPGAGTGLAFGGITLLVVLRALSAAPSEFLYFQF